MHYNIKEKLDKATNHSQNSLITCGIALSILKAEILMTLD